MSYFSRIETFQAQNDFVALLGKKRVYMKQIFHDSTLPVHFVLYKVCLTETVRGRVKERDLHRNAAKNAS